VILRLRILQVDWCQPECGYAEIFQFHEVLANLAEIAHEMGAGL